MSPYSSPSKSYAFTFALAVGFAAIAGLNYSQKRDSEIVQKKDVAQLSTSLGDGYKLTLLFDEKRGDALYPLAHVRLILEKDGVPLTGKFHLTESPKRNVEAEDNNYPEWATASQRDRLYKLSCGILAKYRRTPPEFSTSLAVIDETAKRDRLVSHALGTYCPAYLR